MALITKPSALKFATVRARFMRAVARARSPFTYQTQSYVWPGSLWTFEVTLPPLKGSDAVAVITFLRDLANGDNTVQLDVARYTPTDVGTTSGSERLLTLRLPETSVEWDVDRAKRFGIAFTLEEAK